MTKEDFEWLAGISIAIAAIVVPLLFGRKRMSQSQEQTIKGEGTQKQSQKMEE
jgi:hypothetical protein